MKVWFERREELAPGIWQYYFRPERPGDYMPGQYTNFHILEPLNDPRGQARVFSLTSLPSDPHVSFVVKDVEPYSPYRLALRTLSEGAEVRMDEAMGDLVLPKSPAIPLVFIGGGIGVVSFVGMLRQLLEAKETRRVFLFYALHHRHEQIFRDLTMAYPLEHNSLTISPHRLTAEEIASSVPPEALFYLSGSQRFVEGIRGDLLQLGAAHEQIIFDYFEGYVDL